MSEYRITKQELCQELYRIDNLIEEEKSPRRSDMREFGKYSFGVYVQRFGSWSEALEEFDFELNQKQQQREKTISKKQLISELNRLDGKFETVTMDKMREHGEYSCPTYQKRFGSWNNALKEASIETNKEYGITDSDVIKDIKNVSEKYCNGDSPTSVDMKNYGKYSENIYLFSETSWDEYLEKAGFEKKYAIPEENLIEAIKSLASKLNKTPSSRDMKNKGKYTPAPYRRVFGTWNNALQEAGFEVIGYVSGKEHPSWKEDSISTDERRKLENWSKRIKNRDNYECQRCENPRSNVRFAHHIKKRKNYPEIKFDEDNGVTLCADCHAKAHKRETEYNSLKALADELAEKGHKEVYYE